MHLPVSILALWLKKLISIASKTSPRLDPKTKSLQMSSTIQLPNNFLIYYLPRPRLTLEVRKWKSRRPKPMHRNVPICQMKFLIISIWQNVDGFLPWLSTMIKPKRREKMVPNHYPDYVATALVVNQKILSAWKENPLLKSVQLSIQKLAGNGLHAELQS